MLEFVRRRGLDKTCKEEEEEEKEDLRIIFRPVRSDGVGDIPIRFTEDIRNASVVLKML